MKTVISHLVFYIRYMETNIPLFAEV